jgi:hypothetical protein
MPATTARKSGLRSIPTEQQVAQSDLKNLESLNLADIAANGFRTLGVNGSASQAAITMAARRMRIWPDESNIPPSPWDLAWLGPLSRNQMALQKAVARLGEPTTRIVDRLLWYAGDSAPAAPAGTDAPAGVPPASAAVRHDQVIGALHGAMVQDARLRDLDRWRDVIGRLIDWCQSVQCTEWFLQVETAGKFDKPATEDEIIAALFALPPAVGGWVSAAAMTALQRGDGAQCGKLLDMVHSFEGLGQEQSRLALADRLEDQAIEACAKVDAELRPVLKTIHTNPQKHWKINFAVTQFAADEYARRVEPVLRQLTRLVGDDPSRIGRANTSAANVELLIALGWEWSGRFMLAEQTLIQAAELLGRQPGYAKVQQTLARVRTLAAEQRNSRKSRLFGSKVVSPVEGYVPRSVRKARKAQPKQPSKSWIISLVLVGSAIIRAISSSSDSHDSRTTPYYNPLSNTYKHVVPAPIVPDPSPQAGQPTGTVTHQPYDNDLVAPNDPIGETNREK